MGLQTTVHDLLPDELQPIAKAMYLRASDSITAQYRRVHPRKRPIEALHAEFIDTVFDSRSEYERYVTEFEEGSIAEIRNDALAQYQRLTGQDDGLGAISLDAAREYYTITRKIKPETVIETGVCNGLSTVAVLLALKKNKTGVLHSIDYPFRVGESLADFRTQTFEGYGGAAIPSDKDPGWIVPDELRNRWELTLGKSQIELPRVVVELGEFDLFIHDSEHSHPCMMFEYELAYEWLNAGGMVVSDDITWNDAFDIFTENRDPESGKVAPNLGYMRKR